MQNPVDQAESQELALSLVQGYKVGAKKTIEELAQLDAEDDDPRVVVPIELVMETENRPNVIMKLEKKEDLLELSKKRLTLKGDVTFCLKAKFRVQHEVVTGLKYVQIVKRMGIVVDKMEKMLGSYSPSETPYEKGFTPEEAPSASIIGRGHYDVRSIFIDDDNVIYLDWTWSFDIKKNWD